MLSQSPYVPPSANLEPEVLAMPGTGDFEFKRCLSEAWAATWSNFPLWLGAGIVWLLATFGAMVTVIGAFLIAPVLAWGASAFCLAMYDGGARIGDLFRGFSCYGRALAGVLVFWIASSLVGVPTNLLLWLAESSGVTLFYVVAAVLHVVVLFVLSARMGFAPLLMVDRGLGGMQAVSESWYLTAPVQWKLVGLILLMMLVFAAGLLVVGIGLVPAGAMAVLMNVSAYRQIAGGPQRA